MWMTSYLVRLILSIVKASHPYGEIFSDEYDRRVKVFPRITSQTIFHGDIYQPIKVHI